MIEHLEHIAESTDNPILMRDLVANYASAQVFEIVPVSTLDAQVINIFSASEAANDADIARALDSEDDFNNLERLMLTRSRLFATRACYEIDLIDTIPKDTGRDIELARFVGEVTEFTDKLTVFRHAISKGNETALSWLCDLREEAEKYANVNNDDSSLLASYLIEEIRAGYNLDVNVRLVELLIAGTKPNAAIGVKYNTAVYKEAIEYTALDSLVKGDTEQVAQLIKELDGKPARRLSVLLLIRQQNLKREKVVRRERRITEDNSRYSYYGLNSYTLKSKYEWLGREDTYYPSRSSYTQQDCLVRAALDPSPDLQSKDGIKFKSNFIDMTFDEGQMLFLEGVAPDLVRLHQTAHLSKMHDDNHGTMENLMTMSLLATKFNIEDQNERSQKDVEVALEILANDYASDMRDRANNDVVDRTRFRVTYNNRIDEIYGKAKVISSPPHRFKAMAMAVSMKAIHDASSDGNFAELLRELNAVSDECSKSSVHRLVVGNNERELAIERIMKIAYPEAKEESSEAVKEATKEDD